MTLEKCINQPCPYYGYTDTKKCWYHSQELPLPEGIDINLDLKPAIGSEPMTFKEALKEYEGLEEYKELSERKR